MSFDYSTLITDRTRSDSDTLKALLGKPMAEWTAEERTAFNGAVMRGSYDYTDLNRVGDCLEDLVARLGRVGCNVPGYERLKIERAVTPSSRLPAGYTEVEYIQSNGEQYINSKLSAPSGFRALCCVEMSALPKSLNMLFGSHDTSSPYYRNFLAAQNNKIWQIGAYDPISFGAVEIGQKYNIDVCTISGAIGCIINGIVQNIDASGISSPLRSARPVYIFGLNYTDGLFLSSMKLYGFQFYTDPDGNNLARDYIPCTNANGAAGLYDLVGQEFYGNAGSGSFAAGPVVDRPKDPSEGIDPYTWYESDVPTASLLARYRANVAAVRAVLRLPEGTLGVPETMRRLTVTEANSIEMIFLALNFILNHIPAAVRHCGVTVCGGKGVRA